MRVLVPQSDRGPRQIVLVADSASAGRAEQAITSRGGLEPQPARREHAQEVSAREEQHVLPHTTHPADGAVGARGDLVGRLPSRATVAEELPAGALRVDLGARATLVV